MRRASRREFLRLSTIGPAIALLAACRAEAPAPAPTTAPVKPAAPVATQPPPVAAAPTSAPTAASKPAAAAAAPPKPAATVRDVSFVVADGTEPLNLDPAAATGPWQHIINGIYEGLVNWTARMEIEPGLATTWQSAPDGSWTFKLRPGVTFHDGTPFTSQAVKATVEHILDPATASGRRANYALIKTVETPDDLTVRFVTDPPTPDLPFLMADGSIKIVSPTALQKFGKDFGRNPVGTGPFKFEEWIPNDHVSAVIFDEYWGPKPRVRRFVYKPIPEASARVVALKTGEVDVAFGLPPDDVEGLRQDANLVVEATMSQTMIEVEPAQSQPPLKDVKVRRALNHAIDKNAIINGIMKGMAGPLNSPSIPGLWGTVELAPLKFDPALAKQLLAEAGFPNGIDLNIYHTSGRWAGDDQVVEAVQGYWNNVGARTKITKLSNAERSSATREHPDKRAGTLALLPKSSEYIDYHLFRMYHSSATNVEGAAQRTAYANTEVDKLLDEQRRTFDQEKRLPLLKRVQEILWEDQPLIFLFQPFNIWGHRKTASGFRVLASNELMPDELQKP